MSFSKSRNGFKSVVVRGLIVLIVAPSLFLSVPQKAHAQWAVFDVPNTVAGTANSIWGGITSAATTINTALTSSLAVKEFLGDGIANFIAKMIIKQLTAQTVNWINSGFKGNPGYVTDPQQFFLNIGDNTASKFISSTKLNALCTPFNAKVRLALVKNYINIDQENYSCTIDKIVQNYDNFTRDFSQGGWDGWFSMTQTDTNSPLGAYVKSQNQLSIQIGNKQRTVGDQLTQGGGFLSQKKCTQWSKPASDNTAASKTTTTSDPLADYYSNTQVDLSVANDPSGEGEGDTDASGQVCVKSEIVTPGKVIADQLNKAIGSSIDGLVAADEINEVISALMTQLVSRVVGGIGNGLRGASQPSAGQPSLIQKIQDSLAPTSPENTGFYNQINGDATKALTPPSVKTQAEVDAEARGKVNTDRTGLITPDCVVAGTCPLGTPIPTSSAPTINLVGSSILFINKGAPFIDQGASVTDSVTGTKFILGTGNVNTSVAGTYTLTYSYTDSNGFSAAPVTRTVVVNP